MKAKILIGTILGIGTTITALALTMPEATSSHRTIIGVLWIFVVLGQIGLWVSLSKYSSYYAKLRDISHMPNDSIMVCRQRSWGLVSLASGYLRNISFFTATPLTILLLLR